MTALTLIGSPEWSRSDLIALISLAGGILACVIALYTLHRSNLNSSVATMVALTGVLQLGWQSLVDAGPKADPDNPLSEVEIEAAEDAMMSKLEPLMNAIEQAAAIGVEGTLSGVSRKIMDDYTRKFLRAVIANEWANSHVSDLLQDDKTYIYIRRFLAEETKSSIIVPPEWYTIHKSTPTEKLRAFLRI